MVVNQILRGRGRSSGQAEMQQLLAKQVWTTVLTIRVFCGLWWLYFICNYRFIDNLFL